MCDCSKSGLYNILIKSNRRVRESARYFFYHLSMSLKSFRMQRVEIVEDLIAWSGVGIIEDLREVNG